MVCRSLAWTFVFPLALSFLLLDSFANTQAKGGISVAIESPPSGLSTPDSSAEGNPIRITINGGDLQSLGFTLIVFVNGLKWTSGTQNHASFIAPHAWPPSVHSIRAVVADGSGNNITASGASFLVYDPNSSELRELACKGFATSDREETQVGFDVEKWRDMRACLTAFAEKYKSSAAVFQLALIDEAEGLWEQAAQRFASAGAMGYQHAKGSAWLQHKIEELRQIQAEEKQKPSCSWRSFAQCSSADSQTCRDRESLQDVGIAPVLDQDEDADLYLSIIMVTRHDNTQFCQSPPDACLNRFRASISILLNLLAKHNLASDTELLLVEWNPCYVNSKQEEGACDPREDGYVSVEQMVKQLVIPPEAEGFQVRVLFVSEEEHDKLYNPYDFDLMEFIGKNVAARRARGQHLLFGNPDDVWAEELIARLAMRELKPDVFYSTFRGAVLDNVPVAKGASVRSLQRFVEERRESTEFQPQSVAHVAGNWRRAACLKGEEDDEPMRSESYGFFHDSAAGDFLLMSRRIIRAIRGYPEIPTNIMIDGTAIHAAAGHGFGQLVFAGACVIYHQPHPRSYNTKGSMISLQSYESLAQQLLSAKHVANHRPRSVEMKENQERVEEALPWHRWNDELWGLAASTIPQVILSPSCIASSVPHSAVR
mmetsp:Transcript_42166/g.98897  ORF Transcript_42166/g.98897 Transcript_42166/m.98897 type:complete len:655 (+) Transcript_42166:116-2080(+)